MAFAVLYGICETVNANWAQLNVTRDLGEGAAVGSMSLTAFWAAVTAGRLLFAAAGSPRLVYHLLPLALAMVLAAIAALPQHRPIATVLAYGLAGLACSALLPLTISFGQRDVPADAGAVSGGIIASYQVGYGIAAFGVGPLLGLGISLTTVYAWAAVVALAMGGVSVVVTASGRR
jgi:predicted MFS family arabinose efflux permease